MAFMSVPFYRTCLAARSFDGPVPVVKRSKKYTMPRGDPFNLRHPFRSDETASLGKRLEPAFKRQRHPLQQTAVDDVREWMPVQHAVEIRPEAHAAQNLPKSAKEDSRVWQYGTGCQILGVPRVAEDCILSDPA